MTDATDRKALARSLVETYQTASTASPWELVQQYRRVAQHTAEYPQQGSAAVARAVELPRSRIRAWVDDGGRPDAQRGLEVAERHDWLDFYTDDAMRRPLATLVAWVFAGGSVSSNWVPNLAVTTEDDERRAAALLDAVGVDSRVVREGDPKRSTEVRPANDAAVLGRVLVALGAPQGPKNDREPLSLPAWLPDVDGETRLRFARTYVWLRGTERSDRVRTPVQINEDRPEGFLRALRAFLGELVGEENVRGDGRNIRLTAEAAATLWHPPQS